MSGDGWPYTEEQARDHAASRLRVCELCGVVNHEGGYVHERCRDDAARADGECHETDCGCWTGEGCDCD